MKRFYEFSYFDTPVKVEVWIPNLQTAISESTLEELVWVDGLWIGGVEVSLLMKACFDDAEWAAGFVVHFREAFAEKHGCSLECWCELGDDLDEERVREWEIRRFDSSISDY